MSRSNSRSPSRDCVVTRWTVYDTYHGALQAIPPTGRQVTISGLSLHRLHAGWLLNEWTSFDALALVQQQLWAVPTRSPIAGARASCAGSSHTEQ